MAPCKSHTKLRANAGCVVLVALPDDGASSPVPAFTTCAALVFRTPYEDSTSSTQIARRPFVILQVRSIDSADVDSTVPRNSCMVTFRQALKILVDNGLKDMPCVSLNENVMSPKPKHVTHSLLPAVGLFGPMLPEDTVVPDDPFTIALAELPAIPLTFGNAIVNANQPVPLLPPV